MQFAEKRKEFASSDATDEDVLDDGSDASVQSSSAASTPAQLPKAARLLVSSLNEELSSLKDSMTGNQDKVASTGQFLVHMMRDMTESTRQEFILTVTKMAIEAVQSDKADLARQYQQEVQQQHVFAVPTRRPPPSAAAGSASQLQPIMYHDQQLQQDFQLATNIAASAPPAHITPRLSSYRHLQPPNVHPVFIPSSSTSPSTSSIFRQAMTTASIPNTSYNTSFNVDTFEANLETLPRPAGNTQSEGPGLDSLF